MGDIKQSNAFLLCQTNDNNIKNNVFKGNTTNFCHGSVLSSMSLERVSFREAGGIVNSGEH